MLTDHQIIRQAALNYLETAEQDLHVARRKALKDVPNHPQLMDALWKTAIVVALDDVWRDRRRETLNVFDSRSELPTPSSSSGVTTRRNPFSATEHLKKHTGGLLELEMPDGTFLGDWTKAQLIKHANEQIKKAHTTLGESYFQKAVASLLKKDRDVIREHLMSKDLERVRKQQAGVRGKVA